MRLATPISASYPLIIYFHCVSWGSPHREGCPTWGVRRFCLRIFCNLQRVSYSENIRPPFDTNIKARRLTSFILSFCLTSDSVNIVFSLQLL